VALKYKPFKRIPSSLGVCESGRDDVIADEMTPWRPG